MKTAVIFAISFAFALCLVWANGIHAAIHTDKPTQETTPVASKDQTSSCFQSNAVVTFLRDEQGNWHRLTVYGPIEACGH